MWHLWLKPMLHDARCVAQQNRTRQPNHVHFGWTWQVYMYVARRKKNNTEEITPRINWSRTTTNLAIPLHKQCQAEPTKTKHNDDSGSVAVTRVFYRDGETLASTQENTHTTAQEVMLLRTTFVSNNRESLWNTNRVHCMCEGLMHQCMCVHVCAHEHVPVLHACVHTDMRACM